MLCISIQIMEPPWTAYNVLKKMEYPYEVSIMIYQLSNCNVLQRLLLEISCVMWIPNSSHKTKLSLSLMYSYFPKRLWIGCLGAFKNQIFTQKFAKLRNLQNTNQV